MFHPKGPSFFELARQALSSTEQGYDLLAPKFDFTPFRTPDHILHVVADELREHELFDSALDICCGTGAGMELLRPFCTERIVGLDMSQGMLDVARSHSAYWPGTSDVEFARGNALEMPFQAEFDLAVCFGAFGHILPRDEPRFVAEIARVLRPGGKFIFVTSTMPPLWSIKYWFCRTFNAAMHVRNWLVRPPFVMFYLTFLVPAVERLLDDHGFKCEIRSPCAGPLSRMRLVVATKQ